MKLQRHNNDKLNIPEFINKLLIALRHDPETWRVDGLFRLAGSRKQVEMLRAHIDAGEAESIDFGTVQRDVNGDLLKQYMRELPHPLICAKVSQEWLHLLEEKDEIKMLHRVKELMKKEAANHVEAENDRKHLLKDVLEFCVELCGVPATRMSPESIGTVMGPNLFKLEGIDMAAVNLSGKVTAVIVKHYKVFFG